MQVDASAPPGEGAVIRSEMVDYLVGVVRSRPEGRQLQTAVNAARTVIQAIDAQRTPEQTLIEILGSEEAAAQWMRDTLPRLEARIAARARALVERTGDE